MNKKACLKCLALHPENQNCEYNEFYKLWLMEELRIVVKSLNSKK